MLVSGRILFNAFFVPTIHNKTIENARRCQQKFMHLKKLSRVETLKTEPSRIVVDREIGGLLTC